MSEVLGPIAHAGGQTGLAWAVAFAVVAISALVLGYVAIRRGKRLRIKVGPFALDVWPNGRRGGSGDH
jgi:hypothetical protein